LLVKRDIDAQHEDGAVLMTVVIVMLVLAMVAIAVAGLVVSTAGVVSSSRSTAQSRAAADAGIADAVATAKRTGNFCGLSLSGSTPQYTATSTCAGGNVTFVSTGFSGAGKTRTQAVYAYTPAATSGYGADFYAYSSMKFTSDVITMAPPARLLNIVVRNGSFTCQSKIPGNITVNGDFNSNGGCIVSGKIWAGGVATLCCVADHFLGDFITAGTASAQIRGVVDGQVWAGGPVKFGSAGTIGSVIAGGNVDLGGETVTGSVTLPTTATFVGAAPGGGVTKVTTPAKPPTPTISDWFDYKYKASDWPGFAVTTLADSGNNTNPTSCKYYNNSPGTGWTNLSTLSQAGPVTIDARACDEISTNNGSSPTISLKNDLLILSENFDLTTLKIVSADGQPHKVWFVNEDTVADSKPSCPTSNPNQQAKLFINGTVITSPIKAMAYSQCRVDVGSMNTDTWNGSIYAGAFTGGGKFTFYGDPILLPGQTAPTDGSTPSTPAGTNVLGSLVSRRDIP